MNSIFKINKKNISLLLCFVTIASYVILGNSATFNLGNRLPIKIAEIISIPTILVLFLNFKNEIKITKFSKGILIFIFICIFSIIFNEIIYKYSVKNVLYSFLYPLRILHLIILTSLICMCFKKYSIKFEKIINFFMICYGIVSVLGIIQLIFFPEAHKFYGIFYKIGVYFPNPDPHIGRIVSTYFDPNFLGCCLLIPFAFSFVFWITKNQKRYLLALILFSVTIILTVSRSALLGALIISIIVFFKYILKYKENKILKIKLNEKLVILCAIAILCLLILICTNMNIRVFDRVINSMNDGSTFARFESWKYGFSIFNENKLLGIGYNTLGFYQGEYNAVSKNNLSTMFGIDSSLLLILSTTGIIGIIYFLYFLLKNIIKLIYKFKTNHNSIILFTILISAIVCCNFNNLLFYILWLFPIFMISNLYELEEKDNYNKKIVVDARMVNMSGIGTYIKNLIKNDIFYYALGKKEELKSYFDDERIIEYNSKIYGIKEQIKFPYMKLLKIQPDILFIPHYNVPIFYSGRMVVTIHDLTHLVLPQFLPNKFAYFYAKVMIWIAIHKSEHIFTVSENTKKDLIRLYKVADSKITVTYNGVGNEFVRKEKSEIGYLYKKFNIPTDKKIIMYVGNLKPHKNLERLLEAFSKIENKNDKVLLLVGKAFEKYNVLEDREKELNISENVIHTGIVTQEELVDLYNLADLFVFPSLYEGFGLPILEALKCGTPVICSNNSSMPEVGKDLVDYFDAYNSDEIREKIEENINSKSDLDYKKIVKLTNKFNWNDVAVKTKEYLQ